MIKDKKEITQILIADDHPMMRQSLRSFLEKQTDFEVIAEAGDGEEAIRLALETIPDVVIMDISMPKINGLEATKRIKEKCPEVAVLILTAYTDIEYIIGLVEAGAAGYLTKNIFGEEIAQAIRSVVAGESVLTPAVLQKLIQLAPRKLPTPGLRLNSGEKLSSREHEILTLAARGLSNKDIALELGISVRTVKSHLADIFSKLEVGSRTEAVMKGLQEGFLKVENLQ